MVSARERIRAAGIDKSQLERLDAEIATATRALFEKYSVPLTNESRVIELAQEEILQMIADVGRASGDEQLRDYFQWTVEDFTGEGQLGSDMDLLIAFGKARQKDDAPEDLYAIRSAFSGVSYIRHQDRP